MEGREQQEAGFPQRGSDRPGFDIVLIERLSSAVEGLLPTRLQTATPEDRRLASLVLYSIAIAEIAVLASAVFLWRLGLYETAQNVLFLLAVQASIGALLYLNVSPRLCGHLLIMVFFLELIWDYGPDGGYGVMNAALVPLAATAILGGRAGLTWTAISVIWCIGVWPLLARYDDYSDGVAEGTAILSTIIGLGAWVLESTRVLAVSRAGRSLTLQKQAESAMQLFLETTFPAHVHTTAGVLTRVSPGVGTLLGYEDADLLGLKLRTLLHPDDQQLIEVLLGTDRGEGFRAELRLRHKLGHWVWSEVFGVLVGHANSPAAGEQWLFVARNVDDEHHARDRLARAHRLEGVGVLAAGLAHDFNNLVMVMRGFAELLPPSAERASILAAADEAGDLTANLLAFGRHNAGGSGVIDLRANILKWASMLQRVLGSAIRLETHLPDAPMWCAITDGQLNQVLLNLVTNAKHALPSGGSLVIRLAMIELPPPQAKQRALPPGRYALLAVVDDGVGMSTEVLAQAVDPFFTTKAPTSGSGLGLASVYAIVTALGGALELESAPGKGTTVLIYMPIAETDQPPGSVDDSRDAKLRFTRGEFERSDVTAPQFADKLDDIAR